MKVGIVSLYYKMYNYGALLQAYALQKTVEKMGCECEHIRFKCIKQAVMHEYEYILSINHNAVDPFIDKIPHSKEIYTTNTVNRANTIYDTFICGSDEIWGSDSLLPIHILPQMMLSFADNGKGKIAYAASCGSDEPIPERRDVIKEFINDFDYISIREGSAAEMIQKYTDKPVFNAVDPVFLLERSEWERCAVSINYPDTAKGYILVYSSSRNEELMQLANAAAASNNMQIINISDKLRKMGAIEEFLYYIMHAEHIVTNSFYATAFSVIFNKQFAAYGIDSGGRCSKNTRITDMLERIGLSDRFSAEYKYDARLYEEKISYEAVNELLSEWIDDSREFLKRSLKKSEEKAVKCNGKMLSVSTEKIKTGKDYLERMGKYFSEDKMLNEQVRICEFEKYELKIKSVCTVHLRRMLLSKLDFFINAGLDLRYVPGIGDGDIFIYGAGVLGKKLAMCTNDIKGFIDINSRLESIVGLQVYHPTEDGLRSISKSQKCTVIITPVWDIDSIKPSLERLLPKANVISLERILD